MKPFTPRPYQNLIVQHIQRTPRCAVWAGMGLGKQQPNSEPVLTPTGWRPMGTLRAGDFVIGADGAPTQVLAVFPQGEHETVRVTFSDGAFCHVGWEHLWYVQNLHQKARGQVGHVMTTRELVDSGLRRPMGGHEQSVWHVPMVRPVQFTEKALPIEPYTLGVLLGDGCLTGGWGVVCSDVEILEALGVPTIRPHATAEGVGQGNVPKAAPALRELGLAGASSSQKFVPEVYLRGSVAQRLALLQGLLDTDGYATPQGGVEFSSTAPRLIEAVCELAQSLGGTARTAEWRRPTYQGGVGKPACRVNVKLPADTPPFRLTRKLAAWKPPSKYPPARLIRSAEVVGREEATCIKVAAADSLYVTRDYIVTHNTSSTLMALETLRLFDDSPTIVLAPKRVAQQTWPDEVKKWDQFRNLRVSPIVGTERERTAALMRDADIYTTNYENVPWLVEKVGRTWPFRKVVSDEATKLKNFRLKQGGKRARALGRVAHEFADVFVELTGTPSPNTLIDLWGQMWFLDKGQRLGRTFQAYKDRWFRAGHNGFGQVALDHSQAEIQDLLADLCITLDAKDWFDLREPIVNNVFVDLPSGARRVYNELEKEMFAQLESGDQVEAFNAASRTIKCLQLANGAVYTDDTRSKWEELHDLKLQALDEIVEEASGMPVLTVYHFKHDLARIKAKFGNAVIDLGTAEGLREAQAGKGLIWLGHPQSMGHGVDGLQNHSNQLAFYGHWWNLEERMQVIERVGPTRQAQAGFDRPTFIHNIIARGTVDELVIERVNSKREVQDILLAAMKRKRGG